MDDNTASIDGGAPKHSNTRHVVREKEQMKLRGTELIGKLHGNYFCKNQYHSTHMYVDKETSVTAGSRYRANVSKYSKR